MKLKLRTLVLWAFLLVFGNSFSQDITIDFCPVTKIQASKDWSSTITITNNTGVVLDLANNDFTTDWPSLVTLPWPFSDGVQTGTTWDWKLNLDWPGTLAVGGTASKAIAGAKFSGVLQFPTSGTYTQGGTTYNVVVNHCMKTDPYELYDAQFDFKRECFITSPTSNMCLGEAATEIWQGEGVFDAAMPNDRPSWAIGTMVAHRLFTNLVGKDILSPNFWTATAMNESRMTCDPTIVPDVKNHWAINGQPSTGAGTYSVTDNCFQVLNIGYAQIENNQPDLFAQTNAYGTASYSTVIAGGAYETGALAVTAYHYQDIRYWNQIFCWNACQFDKDANDPYAVEKVFYHAFHDGPNAGIALLNDIDANYAAATATTDMNSVITTGGTWSALGGGSSRKVANFTSLLDGGNGHLFNSNYNDGTQEYYGCYEESIKWTDITFYLDKIKILYPQVMDAPVQAAIKAVFDGLNGGGDVLFSNLGPVIDEIVIQMGGHDPSKYIATQYAASKVCNENPVGVSLRTNDTICPGETAELQVWLAGDQNFRVDIKFPDGSVNSYTNIAQSPYIINVTDPGDYEVVYFEDADEIGDVNCNFAKITIESKNGSVIGWDKTTVDAQTGCATGDLIINKTGTEALTISYTLDGLAQTDIVMGANETSKTIASNVAGNKEYIITTMSPNSCGTPINDTINFCGSCTKPTSAIADKGTTEFCVGDSVELEVTLTGAQPWSIKVNDGTTTSMHTGIAASPYSFFVKAGGIYSIDSVFDNNTCPDAGDGSSVVVTMNTPTKPTLGVDTAICAGDSIQFDAGNYTSYQWANASTATTQTVWGKTAGDYEVEVTDADGCTSRDTVVLSIKTITKPDLGVDQEICEGDSVQFDAGTYTSYQWANASTATTQTIWAKTAGDYEVEVTAANGCTARDTVNLVVNTITKPDLGTDQTICNGDSVQFDAGTYTSYQWANASTATTQTIWAKTAGDYEVEVTDAKGCKASDTVAVIVNQNPKPDLGVDTSYCQGSSVTLDAGVFANYQWSDASTATTQTVIANAAGQYIVEVTDANGCKGKDTVNVTENNNPKPAIGPDSTICNGSSVALDAGTFTSYQWSDASTATTQTISATVAGRYIVEVTDANGCKGKDTMDLVVNQNPTVNLGNDLSACKGPFTLDAGSSVVGQTYEWSTTATSQTIDVNSNGINDYWVIVSVGACKDSDTIRVNIDTTLTFNIGNDTALCDYNTPLSLSGPNGMVSYQWNNLTAGTSLGTSQNQNVTTTGSYEVFVEDNTGCKGRDTLVVTVKAQPKQEAWTTDTLTACAVSLPLQLDAGAIVGATYLWSTTDATQTSNANAQGDYWVKWTVNGCSDSDSVYVKVGNSLTVDLGGDVDLCVGATNLFDSKIAGVGTTYNWYENDGASVGSNKTYTTGAGFTGEIRVNVEDVNGCKGADSVTVNIVNPLVIDLGADVSICADRTNNVDLQLIPARVGLNYNWDTGSTDSLISVLPVNTTKYVLTVDSAGCTYKDSTGIIVNPLPTVALANDTFICAGANQSIAIDAGAGFANYQWSDASTATTQLINATAAGKYVVTVTDANGCTNKDSLTITEENSTTFDLGNDAVICPAGSHEIDVPKGVNTFTYIWQDNSNIDPFVVENELDGTSHKVVLTVTNNFGCISKDSLTVSIQNVLPVSLEDTSICEGTDITFISGYAAGGNYVFQWMGDATNNDNSYTINNVPAGNQNITLDVVDTALGCSGSASATLTVNLKPTPNITSSAPAICEGQSADLTATTSAGNSFEWNWGANTQVGGVLTVTESALYEVVETDAIGCVGNDTMTIIVAPVPMPVLTVDPFCLNYKYDRVSCNYPDNDRYNFVWLNPLTTQNKSWMHLTGQGAYGVTVTDTITGCSGKAVTGYIKPSTPPMISLNGLPDEFCTGSSIEVVPIEILDVDPNSKFYWSNGTESKNLVTNLPGTYHLISSLNGCNDTDSIVIKEIGLPTSSLREDTILCFDFLERGLKLDAGSDFDSLKWSNGEITSTISVDKRGTYSVTLFKGGCTITDEVTIKNNCPFGVWLPSAFTPNEDGVNDVWEIKGVGIESVEVLVFNRWGQLLWTGRNIGEFWDGTYMNNLVQTDVYVYKVNFTHADLDNIVHTKSFIGRVTVLK